MSKSLKLICTVLLILSLLSMPVALARESSTTSLDVSVLKYEPCPAEIGQYVDVWIKVDNFQSGRSDDVSIELVPEYPLSLDSNSNAIKNIGILAPDTASVQEYRLYVDENAKPGTGSFDIRYQGESGDSWLETSCELKVGSTTYDSKGSLELEEVTTDPAALLPGDTGTITFKLTNSATQHSVTFDGTSYDTNAHIQSATLSGSKAIEVDATAHSPGIIGPGDSVTLTYNIHISEDIEDGTYYLELSTLGNSHAYNNNWKVPLEVDSSSIKIIKANSMSITQTSNIIQFDVANLRPNTINSVSIRPEAEGFEFIPAEYFVGSMKPDELFTIEFEARPVEGETSSAALSLYSEYNNGFTEHEDVVKMGNITLSQDKGSDKDLTTIAGLGALMLIIPAGLFYRKKKNS